MAHIVRLDSGYEFDIDNAVKIRSEYYESADGWIICTATEWPYAEEELYKTAEGKWVIHNVNTFLAEYEHNWFEIAESDAIEWIQKYAQCYDTIAL